MSYGTQDAGPRLFPWSPTIPRAFVLSAWPGWLPCRQQEKKPISLPFKGMTLKIHTLLRLRAPSHMVARGRLGSVAFLFRGHIPGKILSLWKGGQIPGAESRIIPKVFSGYSGSSKS